DARAIPPLVDVILASAPQARAPQVEAVTAIAKIGGDDGARALGDVLAAASPGNANEVVNAALIEAWRLGARAPLAQLVGLTVAVVPLVADRDIGVSVQAETTLGVLGGSRALEALRARLTSSVFALRRQALIAVAQADSGAGVAAAAAPAGDADWRWRSVA